MRVALDKFYLRVLLVRLTHFATKSGVFASVFMLLVFSTFFASADVAAAQTKSLKLYYTHTKERATITFKRNGRYDQAGLKKLNKFLRDWRRNEPTKMDPRLFDVLWEVYRQSGAKEHIHIVSAYRSPATNEMLRRTRGGQAKKSQHMVGRAIDFYIPGVKVSKLRAVGMKMQAGGVGYYPKSGSPFVHIDVGSVRAWPRMSRAELVRLFPDGKTLHLPPDGKPLPGYKVALADYKRRGAGVPITSRRSTAVARADGGSSGGLLGNLFNRENEKSDNSSANTVVASAAPAPAVEAPQFIENLEPLPRTNIPVPNLLNPGTPAPTLVASVIQDDQVKTFAETANDQVLPTEVAALAYGEQQKTTTLPSFAAIIAAAIETDKRRKENGEVEQPLITAKEAEEEKPRFTIAALQPPELKPHNRLARPDFGQRVANAAASNKAARPNLRDAIAAKFKAKAQTPTLQQITISQRAFSPDSIKNMRPPAKAPRFVNRFMREAPTVVYETGFSKANIEQIGQNSFSGNAVNFLPVVKYGG